MKSILFFLISSIVLEVKSAASDMTFIGDLTAFCKKVKNYLV